MYIYSKKYVLCMRVCVDVCVCNINILVHSLPNAYGAATSAKSFTFSRSPFATTWWNAATALAVPAVSFLPTIILRNHGFCLWWTSRLHGAVLPLLLLRLLDFFLLLLDRHPSGVPGLLLLPLLLRLASKSSADLTDQKCMSKSRNLRTESFGVAPIESEPGSP